MSGPAGFGGSKPPPPIFGALSGAISTDGADNFVIPAPPGLPNGAQIIVFLNNGVGPQTPAGWTALDSSTAGAVQNCNVFSKTASNEPPVWLFGSNTGFGKLGYTVVWAVGSAINAHALAHDVNTSPTVTTTVPGCQILTLAGADSISTANDAFTIPAGVTPLSASGGPIATAAVYDTAPQAAPGVTTSRALSPVVTAHAYIATVAIAP